MLIPKVQCRACDNTTPEKSAIELLCEASSLKICPRCKCCSMFWQECWNCGGEGCVEIPDGDDIFEFEDSEILICDICDGEGGWYECTCDENGKHKESILK